MFTRIPSFWQPLHFSLYLLHGIRSELEQPDENRVNSECDGGILNKMSPSKLFEVFDVPQVKDETLMKLNMK